MEDATDAETTGIAHTWVLRAALPGACLRRGGWAVR
jgi:hypothetical protein